MATPATPRITLTPEEMVASFQAAALRKLEELEAEERAWHAKRRAEAKASRSKR